MHLYNLNVSLAIPLGSAFQRTLHALRRRHRLELIMGVLLLAGAGKRGPQAESLRPQTQSRLS